MRVQTLEGLLDSGRRQSILDRIFELATQRKSNAQPENLPSSPRKKTVRAHKAQKIQAAPYPGATRTLDRPVQKLSGRRHVPVLVNANRVPFLRIKKPQPPFISRMIRDIAKTREHRINTGKRLAHQLPIAENEDQWDRILYYHTGLDLRSPSEQLWRYEVGRASVENHQLQVDAIRRRKDISAKMYAIVEKEKVLAEEEKLRMRNEKHKARKARRLARRGSTDLEIQEGPSPQMKEAFTRDLPTTTEEVPDQDQEEVRGPCREEERPQRSDKYRTLDEWKRLYETGLRPKTDEEIVEIKKARARRKEEESERKAQKWKRRQEKAASLEKRVNEEVGNSTNKRMGRKKLEVSQKVEESINPRLNTDESKVYKVVEESTNQRPDTDKFEVNKVVEQSKTRRLSTEEPEVCQEVEETASQRLDTNEAELNREVEKFTKERMGMDKPEDLNKEPLFMRSSGKRVARRTSIQPQPEVSPLPEQPRRASSLKSDAPWRMEESEDKKLDLLCQSLFQANLRNIQRSGQY